MKSNRHAHVEANLNELADAFAGMTDPRAVRRLLEELCTASECRDIALRWRLMKQLAEGRPQRAIARELGVSLCKITRGSKYMKDSESVFRQAVMRVLGRAHNE